MKEIKTRIKVVPYKGRLPYPFQYYAQVQKNFLGFEYWVDIDWEFSISLTKKTIDLYLQKEAWQSRSVEYIDYP